MFLYFGSPVEWTIVSTLPVMARNKSTRLNRVECPPPHRPQPAKYCTSRFANKMDQHVYLTLKGFSSKDDISYRSSHLAI